MRFVCPAFALAIAFAALSACSSDEDASSPATPAPAPSAPLEADAASSPETLSASFPEPNARDLQTTLDGVIANGVAPGVALTVDHPKFARWVGSAGVADLATKAPLTGDHRFRAGSMLKLAIATSIMQLVEAGKRSLDDKLTAILPTSTTSRITSADAITVRMLLGHTSGIPEFTNGDFDSQIARDPGHVWTLAEQLDRVAAQAPSFAPGGGWAYSNTNYVLLGEIVAATLGRPWRDVVAEKVFARADLKQTTLPPEGDTTCPTCARGYQVIEATPIDVTEVDPSMAGAAGGSSLVTTTQDLATFMRALASGSLFDKADTLALMLAFDDAAVLPAEALSGYGLGIGRYRVGNAVMFGHLGGTAGYQGIVLFHPQSGIVMSGCMNKAGNFGAFIMPVLEAVARLP